MNKHYVEGFVKRANEHGLTNDQALELLKSASVYDELKAVLSGGGRTGISDVVNSVGNTFKDSGRLVGNAGKDTLEDLKWSAEELWQPHGMLDTLKHHGGVALRPIRDAANMAGLPDMLNDVAPVAAGVGAAGLGAYGLYKLLRKKKQEAQLSKAAAPYGFSAENIGSLYNENMATVRAAEGTGFRSALPRLLSGGAALGQAAGQGLSNLVGGFVAKHPGLQAGLEKAAPIAEGFSNVQPINMATNKLTKGTWLPQK